MAEVRTAASDGSQRFEDLHIERFILREGTQKQRALEFIDVRRVLVQQFWERKNYSLGQVVPISNIVEVVQTCMVIAWSSYIRNDKVVILPNISSFLQLLF